MADLSLRGHRPTRNRPSTCPDKYVSKLWRDACDLAKPKLSENLRLTPTGAEWEWKLLRKKANTDYRKNGASPKERQAFLGHRTADVNERHYEGLVADRMREIVDAMPSFRVQAG